MAPELAGEAAAGGAGGASPTLFPPSRQAAAAAGTAAVRGTAGDHRPGAVGPSGLPAALLLLLAELADAEGDPEEAAYWRTRAEE